MVGIKIVMQLTSSLDYTWKREKYQSRQADMKIPGFESKDPHTRYFLFRRKYHLWESRCKIAYGLLFIGPSESEHLRRRQG